MALQGSRLARIALLLAVGLVIAQGCSASSDSAGGPGAGAAGAVGRGGSGGERIVMPDAGVPMAGAPAVEINPLCGSESRRSCLPDDARACADFSEFRIGLDLLAGGAGAGGEAGAAGASGQAGGGAGGGAEFGGGGAGGSAGTSAGDAGAAGDGGVGGVVSYGGAGGAGGAAGPPAYACRVARVGKQMSAQCGATGKGGLDAPCFSGGDCGAGLACVALGPIARCRPYCCAGEASCVKGSYCAERPLQDDSLSSGAKASVPVCVPADNCDLGEPYPCPSDKSCTCPSETACMVVRPDGTTSCKSPEGGGLGQPCPCNFGFVCSQAAGADTCVQICSTSSVALPCPEKSKCQASAELPSGYGVCVGR